MDSVINSSVLDFDAARRQMRETLAQTALNPSELENSEVIRIEFKVPRQDILNWLARRGDPAQFYWADRDNDLEAGGMGIAQSWKGRTGENYTQNITKISQQLAFEHPNLKCYGGVGFDHDHADTNAGEEWSSFGSYQFFIPLLEILNCGDHGVLACNLSARNFQADSARVLNLLRLLDEVLPSSGKMVLSQRVDQPSESEWMSSLKVLIAEINEDKGAKTVLARRSGWRLEGQVNPFELMRVLRETMGMCFHFCFQFDPEHVFFGASPERLFKRRAQTIWTEALAGTRPRGDSPKHDQTLGEALLTSKKDMEEHQFVVNAIQEALRAMCFDFQNLSDASLMSFKGGHHLLSQFEGRLKDSARDVDILSMLHPTPAVGGHPLPKALEQIRLCEPFSRGWYAGPVGYLGAATSEFAVAIRSGLIAKERLFLFAGAGIVADSNPADEWQEVEEKMKSLLSALSSL